MVDFIELFFFAYRDFVGDADRLLENYGFGRAHHRVLHFVSRRPGLPIAALLDILKITKQSLNRVLKQLLDAGFVEARPGAIDRRQRLLFATPNGARLAQELAALQSERFRRVFGELPPKARRTRRPISCSPWSNPSDREGVRAHLSPRRRAPRRRRMSLAAAASPERIAPGAIFSSSTTTSASAPCSRAISPPRAISSAPPPTPSRRRRCSATWSSTSSCSM